MRRPTFRELINSVAPQDIALEKQDGTTRVGFKAYSIFEPRMIIVPYKNVDTGINVGDIITRYTPSGSERLVVVEPGHHIAFNPEQTDGYPEHFRILYRRESDQDKRMDEMVTISSNQLKKKHSDGTYLVAGIGKVQIPDELQAAANELGGSVAYLCANGSAAKDTIPFYRAVSVVPGEDEEEPIMDSIIPDQKPLHPNSVFVIHGRNTGIKKQIEQFLRALGIKPLEWEQARKLTGKPNPYTWELVDAALREASVIIVLFTPDDEAKLRQEYVSEHDEDFESVLTPQPRPNVLFEAGVAYGRNSQRTLIVSAGRIRPISDLIGHHVLRLNNSVKCRTDFADRLADAGCTVDKSGTDWLEIGNFEMPSPKTKPEAVNEPPIAHQVPARSKPSGNSLLEDFINSIPLLKQESPLPLPNSKDAVWKDVDNALVEIKNMLVSRATGGNSDDDRYRKLRNYLLEFEDVVPLLPRYVVNSRTIAEFWDYIKNKAAKYEERRLILQEDFSDVMTFVEGNVRKQERPS